MILLLEMQLLGIHYSVLSSLAENLIAREVLKNLEGCGKLLPRETGKPPQFEPWSTLHTMVENCTKWSIAGNVAGIVANFAGR